MLGLVGALLIGALLVVGLLIGVLLVGGAGSDEEVSATTDDRLVALLGGSDGRCDVDASHPARAHAAAARMAIIVGRTTD